MAALALGAEGAVCAAGTGAVTSGSAGASSATGAGALSGFLSRSARVTLAPTTFSISDIPLAASISFSIGSDDSTYKLKSKSNFSSSRS